MKDVSYSISYKVSHLELGTITLNRLMGGGGGGVRLTLPTLSLIICPSTFIFDTITLKYFDLQEKLS